MRLAYLAIAIAAIAIGVFFLYQQTIPVQNQQNTQENQNFTMVQFDTSALSNIQLRPWPEDPQGGILVNKTYDPGTLHQATTNGTIHRGTYVEQNRTYIYVTYTRANNSQCIQSAWYSYVFPTVSVGGTQVPNDKIPSDMKSFTDSVGATIRFGEWNADFQKDYEKQNRGKLPQTTPQNNTFPLPQPRQFMGHGPKPIPPGFPYQPLDLPQGSPEPQGFVDSPLYGPDFAGHFYQKYRHIPVPYETSSKPQDITDTMQFVTTGNTYLYCIKPMQCIGYFTWSATESYDISVTWQQVPTALTTSWNPIITVTPHLPNPQITIGPWRTQC